MTTQELAEKIILECPKEGPKAQAFLEPLIEMIKAKSFRDGCAQSYDDAASMCLIYESDEIEEKLKMAAAECRKLEIA